MHPRIIDPNSVMEISPWKNRCAAAAQADFYAEELIEGRLNAEEEADICKMMKDCYGVDHQPAHLKQLLSSPAHFRAPIQRQLILGQAIFEYLEKESAASKRPFIHRDGTMTEEAFAPLAKKFKTNVIFHVKKPAVDRIEQSDAIKSIETPGSARTFDILYKVGRDGFGHYDRIAKTQAMAERHNRWGFIHGGMTDPDHATYEVRDLPLENVAELKKIVSDEIRVIKVADDKFSLFHQKETLRRLEGKKISFNKTAYQKLIQHASAEDNKSNPIEYSLPDGRVVRITEETQKALDMELAKKLQSEEYETLTPRKKK